jgi:drug/metabolite transporter (DMT)-like permease
MKSPIAINLVLLFIAFIWGFGFVPQRLGMDYLGPAAFNAMRFALGALTLLPLLILQKSTSLADCLRPGTLVLGMVLGGLLFGGAFFQQVSIQYTTLANVAFITGLYVIIVPIIGLFIGYRYGPIVWSGGFIAIIGLYLMTGGSTELALQGDILALVGSIFWALHILVLAKLAGQHNMLVLAFYQFINCAIFSLCTAFFTESHLLPAEAIGYLWPALNGFIVVGVAYTLQVLVMEKADPFAASLIFALEAVFGAIAGYLIFTEALGLAALAGAAMMMLGCILAQMPGGELAGPASEDRDPIPPSS